MTDEPHDRLKLARERAGYKTATAAFERFGWNKNTYSSHENGNRGLSVEAADRYARAFRVSREWLLYGGDEMPIAPQNGNVLTLTVSGEVAAGVWRETDAWDEAKYEPVPYVEGRYPGIPVRALRVVGPSVDGLGIRSGDTVVTIPYWTVRSAPQDGDVVVVERRQGSRVETTCKQVVVKRATVELWPRSSDPRYRTPLIVKRDTQADDEEVEIVGLVIAVQREFKYSSSTPASVPARQFPKPYDGR